MDTKRFLLIAVLTGILSVLLHIGGLFSPGWIRTDFVDMGLWYACSYGRCISYQAITDALDSSSISFSYVLSDFFLEFQVEATIGFIAGIIGLASLSAGCRRHVNEARTLITISAIAFLISGIAAWIPAGRLLQLHSSISFLPTTYNVPYSAVLTGLGATLAFIDVIIIFVVRCNSREPASAGQTLSPGYPMQTVVHGNPPNNQYPAYGHPNPNRNTTQIKDTTMTTNIERNTEQQYDKHGSNGTAPIDRDGMSNFELTSNELPLHMFNIVSSIPDPAKLSRIVRLCMSNICLSSPLFVYKSSKNGDSDITETLP